MLIRRKVIVKTIVTDEFKQQLTEQLRQAISRVESSLQELETQGRRYLTELESRDPAQVEVFRRKLEGRINKQNTVKARLVEELSTTENLQPGTEYAQSPIDGFVEVQTGDKLSEKLRTAEIVVKDGVIVEVRHG